MPKSVESHVMVPFAWASVSPDPVQYKPYNPTFQPLGCIVEVPIPSHLVRVAESGTGKNRSVQFFLTPDGMSYATKELSKSINRAHTNQIPA